MNKYGSRINGYALLGLFIGAFIGDKWSFSAALVILVPILILWMLKHDEISFEDTAKKLGIRHE